MSSPDLSNQDIIKPCHSSRLNVKLLENPKIGGFRDFFLSENGFKTCRAVCFPRNMFSCSLLHTNLIKDKNCFGHLLGTSSNASENPQVQILERL